MAIKIPFLKKKDSGVAYVRRSKNNIWGITEEMSRETALEWFLKAYETVPLATAIIETTVNQTIQEFFFEGPNEKKLTTFADQVNVGNFLYNVLKSKLIFGDGYCEVVKKGEVIEKLKVLNSQWMHTYRTVTGDVIGFSQIIKNEKVMLWGTTGNTQLDNSFAKRKANITSIVHFKNNVIGSEKYGRSILEPMIDGIRSKVKIEQDLGKIMKKYVAPLIHAKVGSDEMPAQVAAINSVSDTLKDLSAESEIVTSHLINMEVLSFNDKSMDIKTPLANVDQEIITGGQVPPLLLNRNEAGLDKGAEVQLRSFGRRIKALQHALKLEFEDYIIVGQGLGTFEDKLIWTKAEEREWETDTDIIRGLVTDGVITPQKANDLLPPRFRETLPPPETLQEPRPNQMVDKKVKDNPQDPTKTTRLKNAKGKRVDKNFRTNPLDKKKKEK